MRLSPRHVRSSVHKVPSTRQANHELNKDTIIEHAKADDKGHEALCKNYRPLKDAKRRRNRLPHERAHLKPSVSQKRICVYNSNMI